MTEQPQSPCVPSWYAPLLEQIHPFLTEEEYSEMKDCFPEFFAKKIGDATIKIGKIGRNAPLFVAWLRRKVLWSKEHNAVFFRRISSIL